MFGYNVAKHSHKKMSENVSLKINNIDEIVFRYSHLYKIIQSRAVKECNQSFFKIDFNNSLKLMKEK